MHALNKYYELKHIIIIKSSGYFKHQTLFIFYRAMRTILECKTFHLKIKYFFSLLTQNSTVQQH